MAVQKRADSGLDRGRCQKKNAFIWLDEAPTMLRREKDVEES